MTRRPRTALTALAAVGLLAVAPAAYADGAVSGPGEPVTGHGAVPLSGSVDATERGRVELRVTPPGGAARTVAELAEAAPTDRDRTLSFELTTAPCPQSVCTGGLDAPNGTWSLSLAADRSPASPFETTTSFVLDIPARSPADVRAEPGADRAVTVRWARGSEPDVSWTVTDGADKTTAVAPGDDGACADGVCSTVLRYEPGETGSRTYAVTASRSCGGAGCERRVSAASSSEPVVLGSAPGPGATPGPGGSPSPSPARPGGSGTADTATAFGQGFNNVTPRPGQPALPSGPPPAVAPPPVDGGFEDTLDFPEPGQPEAVLPEPLAAGRDSTLTSTDGGLLRSEELARSAAGALLLLLGAAHLRRWLTAGARDVVD